MALSNVIESEGLTIHIFSAVSKYCVHRGDFVSSSFLPSNNLIIAEINCALLIVVFGEKIQLDPCMIPS